MGIMVDITMPGSIAMTLTKPWHYGISTKPQRIH